MHKDNIDNFKKQKASEMTDLEDSSPLSPHEIGMDSDDDKSTWV